MATQIKEFRNGQDIFDKEYYENGVVCGKSCYQNYQWMPETTIKMAYNIIKHLNLGENDTLLDYGCAKGYVVKALRLLDIDANGCDISRYAISKVDSDVREYCRLSSVDTVIPYDDKFEWIISKDVLEHILEEDLDFVLDQMRKSCNKMFHVVPLGDNGRFRISAYHDDPSHVLMHSEDWWTKKFEQHGWVVKRFDFIVKGIKENWTSKFGKGNGFFVLEKS